MENINWEQVMEVLGYTIGEENKKYLYYTFFIIKKKRKVVQP